MRWKTTGLCEQSSSQPLLLKVSEMQPVYFLKLGGSLITHKEKAHSARRYVLERVAAEISRALKDNPQLQLIIGHGSGSYGHFPATEYQTRQGVQSAEQWRGFIEVWQEARALNTIVMNALHEKEIPALCFPPNAQVMADDGRVTVWDTTQISDALKQGLVPVIYGDAIFDKSRGGTILSTEELFEYLAGVYQPEKILIAGIEEGVWQDYPKRTKLIPTITPLNLQEMDVILSTSEHTDVTGGMRSKVHSMNNLIKNHSCREILIFSGIKANNIYNALCGESVGTILLSD